MLMMVENQYHLLFTDYVTVTLLFYCLCHMTLLFQDTLAQEVKMIARFQEFLEMPINFSVESINYFHPKTL